MLGYPILSYLIFTPLAGAIFLTFTRENKSSQNKFAKVFALLISLIAFSLSVILFSHFDFSDSNYQFTQYIKTLGDFYNIAYHVGVDSVSLMLILLTTFLTPISILATWNSINDRVKEFMILFLLMESLIIGAFCALDFILFYIFFETILIPMFIIIGVWGGENKIYAAIKFFLYTLAGSLFLLIAIIFIYVKSNTLNIVELTKIVPTYDIEVQKYLWIAMFLSFAVKVPMWPLHTWLPDAHVQAPTAGSMILAGILLKLGGYGFIRFSIPMLPLASQFFAPMVHILSIIAVIYASIVAIMQTDMKKLIAYSSVAHMGFVTIGLFSWNQLAFQGAIFQMISHGIVSAGLFLSVGVLYDRLHTKEIKSYGGVVSVMPRFAMFFMILMMASIGLPGSSGFVGELLVIVGLYSLNKIFATMIATGVILGAIYMLWLYKRVMFGEIKNRNIALFRDITISELICFVPLIVMIIILGIYPSMITDTLKDYVEQIINQSAMR